MTLVLVHGAGRDAASLAPLAAALGDLDVIVPALPGRAPTGGAALGSVAELARWLVAFVDAHQDGPAEDRRAEGAAGSERAPLVIAGHSLGGAIALAAALDYPERVAGIGLLSTGARLRVHPATLAAVDGESPPALLSAPGIAPATSRTDWHAADRFDVMDRLTQVRAATMIIAGDTDLLTPAKYARHLAAHIAGAELILLAGAGHFAPLERPVEVAAALRRLHAQVTTCAA